MNKDLKIYAISGKAQHGKDTVANALYEVLTEKGYRVLLTHYADLLKYIAKTFFDWNGEKDEKGRTLLQYIGTDVVRVERPDYWVEFIIDILRLFGENWDYVIIPDTRFPNEIDKLKEYFENVVHLRIVRPDFTSTLTPEQLNHPSEIALDNIEPDYVFWNRGTIEDIKDKLMREPCFND